MSVTGGIKYGKLSRSLVFGFMLESDDGDLLIIVYLLYLLVLF